MKLPLEIVHLVIREATCVPAAFDTSFNASISEDVEAIADAIRESMKTKLALCLVSRSFHDMAIEFLYEIITLHQLTVDHPLVTLLHHKSKPETPHRGWWCRRLQITLGEAGADKYEGSGNGRRIAIYYGYWSMPVRDSLFFSALCIAVHADVHFMPIRFLIPRALFQSIASNCSQTLKRMEIHGNTTIRLDRVELLLKACTALEVFRIEHLEPYQPEWNVYDSIDESDTDECDLELGDGIR
jgi:hypothetical protein